MRRFFNRIKEYPAKLSFRTGMIFIGAAVAFYIISFAQMFIPGLSVAWKGGLWTLFFGLAKTFQYTGIAIIGAEGVRRIKGWWKRRG